MIDQLLAPLYKYSFAIVSVCFVTAVTWGSIQTYRLSNAKNTLEQIKSDYTQATTEHNLAVAEAKAHLEREARVAQQAFAEQATKNRQIKEQKNAEINTLSARLELSNDSLYELAKKAANADQRMCSTAPSTKDKPTTQRLPAADTAANLAAQMADDLARLSQECAANYERLKAEAVELDGWAGEAEVLNK